MRLEFPQVSIKPVDSGRSGDQKIPFHRPVSPIIRSSDADEKSSTATLGMGGTYSIASLKVAAEHQSKFASVAENNIAAAQSVSRIPENLLRMFNS